LDNPIQGGVLLNFWPEQLLPINLYMPAHPASHQLTDLIIPPALFGQQYKYNTNQLLG
jgi:hypothetical protein